MEQRPVILLEAIRHERQELLLRRGFDAAVRRADLRVPVLDRRGQVAGEHLAGVVEEGEHRGTLGIEPASEEAVANDRERVRDHRDAQAVLLDVLGIRVVHQAPALDELHPRQVGEQVAHRATLCRAATAVNFSFGVRSTPMLALAAIVSSLHVLALAIGLPSVFLRGRALRGPLDHAGLLRLFAADNMWAVAAALWLVTGLLRAFAGLEKGSAFYLGAPLFWTKMALFALVVVLEIGPMITFIRWR